MPAGCGRALGVAHQDQPPAAGSDLLHVRNRLVEHAVVRRDHDDRHGFVDECDWAVLEFARGIALGVDVGDFLELERAFERDRIAGAAAEIEHVVALGEVARQLLDLRFKSERFRQMPRHLDQRMHEPFLIGLGQDAARASRRDRKRRQRR